MSDVTVEQKLQLVQQIRSRYSENQYDIRNRERILYEQDYTGQDAPGFRLRLRFLLAGLFFAALVAMDKSHIKVAGITAEMVQRVISADYGEKIDVWVEGLTAVYSSPSK